MDKAPASQLEAHELTSRACGYTATAMADIERGDRLDALDMLGLAQRSIAQAQQRIKASLPEVLRTHNAFARDADATGV